MARSVRRPCRQTGADAAERTGADELTPLVYELLDAHDDTARLAANVAADEDAWTLHLRYLQDLQRVARERLARVGAP
jgi:hypothetical protein